MPFRAVLDDSSFKFGARKQLQHLTENAGYSCHGGGGPPYGSRLSTQTVAEFYRRRSNSNLDKTEGEYQQRFLSNLYWVRIW